MKFKRKIATEIKPRKHFITKKRLREDEIDFDKLRLYRLDRVRKELVKNNLEVLDFLNEKNEWFLLQDKQLSPGRYKVQNPKLLNDTCDEMVWAKDQVSVDDHCFPVGDVFGVDIYEITHVNTDKKIFVTASELLR